VDTNFAMPMSVVAVSLSAGAALLDVRSRRIPNLLTGTALLAGLVAHAVTGGSTGAGNALLGAVVAGGLLMPGWIFGWMGAGDVKLMAAVGAWMGYPSGLYATLASLIAGGVIALVVAARHGVLGRSLMGAATLGAWSAMGLKSGAVPTTGIRFPFGVAIFAGSLVTSWIGF
jgi:prepilin peptidase CpaA